MKNNLDLVKECEDLLHETVSANVQHLMFNTPRTKRELELKTQNFKYFLIENPQMMEFFND